MGFPGTANSLGKGTKAETAGPTQRSPEVKFGLSEGFEQGEARNVTGDEVGWAETLKTLRGAVWIKLRHQNLVQKGEEEKQLTSIEYGTLKRETVNDL